MLKLFACGASNPLDYIILQHSNTHFYKLSENMYFYQVIFNTQILFYYIVSVGVGQNLVFNQNNLRPKWLT